MESNDELYFQLIRDLVNGARHDFAAYLKAKAEIKRLIAESDEAKSFFHIALRGINH